MENQQPEVEANSHKVQSPLGGVKENVLKDPPSFHNQYSSSSQDELCEGLSHPSQRNFQPEDGLSNRNMQDDFYANQNITVKKISHDIHDDRVVNTPSSSLSGDYVKPEIQMTTSSDFVTNHEYSNLPSLQAVITSPLATQCTTDRSSAHPEYSLKETSSTENPLATTKLLETTTKLTTSHAGDSLKETPSAENTLASTISLVVTATERASVQENYNRREIPSTENPMAATKEAAVPVSGIAIESTKNLTEEKMQNGDKEQIALKRFSNQSEAVTSQEFPGKKTGTPGFIYILSALATIGGFLFGYDIGIVAGSMLFIQPYFKLSTFWQEAIVSGTIGAAAIAALMSGWLTDRIGRKLTIMTSSVVFTAGGVLMGAAPTKEILLVGRVVAGLGVGLVSVVVPVYVAESAPVPVRGRLVSIHQQLITTGIIASSLLPGGFSYVKPEGWRYMLGFSALPGVVQFLGFLFMPESPRWLVGRGRIEQAKSVLMRMRGGNDVTEELDDIILTVREAEAETADGIQHFIKIVKTRQVRRAVFIGCSLLFFQQWCGINTVIYYSGTVLKMAGFPVKYAIWLVTVPNLINFLSSFFGLYLVEKIGRRPLLIISLAGTIVGLVILAVGFQLAAENPASLNTTLVETDGNGTFIMECSSKHITCSACVKDHSCGFCYTGKSDGTCLPSDNEVRSSAGRCSESSSTESYYKWAYEYCPSDYTWISLLGMAVFVFAFAPGLGPMPWTINSEIYPLWARSTCNSLAACTAWVCNLVISFTFLTMTEHITIHGSFWLFTAITVVGVIFMVIMLPETRNKTLEEMELLFLPPKDREEILDKRKRESGSKPV